MMAHYLVALAFGWLGAVSGFFQPSSVRTARLATESRSASRIQMLESAKVVELRTALAKAKEDLRSAANRIEKIEALETVNALRDRIDLQLDLDWREAKCDDETLVTKVEGATPLKLSWGVPKGDKGRRAPPPAACAAGGKAASSDRTDVSSAATDVAAALHTPRISVPQVAHLRDWLPAASPMATPYHGGCMMDEITLQEDECVVAQAGLYVDEGQVVLADPVLSSSDALPALVGYTLGGPREHVYFAPEEAKAAIVTCGGLCPGLNTVVKELVHCLRHQYGVETVYGIRHGYMGFYAEEWEELTLASVETIHRQGGSLLGSSRGGHDTAKICDALEAKGVNLIFTIGGDGTMRGSTCISDELIRREAKAVVAHVPKTIDNDIPLVDYTFGFGTAVQEATRAIHTARDEAVAYPNGVGLVRLMGRHSGFIAAYATMAARGVDVCLVPEVEFELEGTNGLLRYIDSCITRQGHCVVVVAEGAGQHLLDVGSVGTDASGNQGLAEIGTFLKDRIGEHFEALGRPASLKYVDPTYMVRATPANAADSILCLQLAHDAVHGAFAGYTGFMAGRVNRRSVMIPTSAATGRRNIAPDGNYWQQLVFATGQPNWGQ